MEEQEGFVTLSGPDTRTRVDLAAVAAIHYDNREGSMTFIMAGSGSISQGSLSQEDRDRIEQLWMAARRKL
jgi:hypothetical protein